MFENFAPFTNCITEINRTKVDDTQDIDIVMPMYNLIEYSDAYSKTSESLFQYYRDEPALDANNNIIDFPADNNNSASFKLKHQINKEINQNKLMSRSIKKVKEFWIILITHLL